MIPSFKERSDEFDEPRLPDYIVIKNITKQYLELRNSSEGFYCFFHFDPIFRTHNIAEISDNFLLENIQYFSNNYKLYKSELDLQMITVLNLEFNNRRRTKIKKIMDNINEI